MLKEEIHCFCPLQKTTTESKSFHYFSFLKMFLKTLKIWFFFFLRLKKVFLFAFLLLLLFFPWISSWYQTTSLLTAICCVSPLWTPLLSWISCRILFSLVQLRPYKCCVWWTDEIPHLIFVSFVKFEAADLCWLSDLKYAIVFLTKQRSHMLSSSLYLCS